MKVEILVGTLDRRMNTSTKSIREKLMEEWLFCDLILCWGEEKRFADISRAEIEKKENKFREEEILNHIKT
jgi:hypothetical protein